MSEIVRGPLGKRKYLMDWIPDKDIFRAVMFARQMIREGTYPGRAVKIAANYYKVVSGDVAHYVGQAAGTFKGRRKK